MYGASDLPCHTDQADEFEHLAAALPATPNWIISPLQRTRQTAEAILAAPNAAHLGQPQFHTIPEFVEQAQGIWENQTWDKYYREKPNDFPRHPFWHAYADEIMEGGESYAQLCARAHPVVDRLTEQHLGQDIIMVGHGGVIRSAVAHALGLSPDAALTFQILNLSLTRIDYRIEPDGRKFWRVVTLNRTLGPPPVAYDHYRYAPKKAKKD